MLESILQEIDRIYGLDLRVDVRDFLVSRQTCETLGTDPGQGSVLVKQGGDKELEVGLYLGEESLDRLAELELSPSMSPAAFELFLLAIEEVSHLAYLLYSASRDKSVTQLELELQAEVDKFVTFALLHAARNDGRVPVNLLDRLFGDFELRSGLDDEKRERYSAASSLASRYCSYVVQAGLANDEGRSRLLPELRSFYRMSQPGKIGRIHRGVYTA
jgi:hypothetical protein